MINEMRGMNFQANGTGCFNLLCSGFVQVHEGLTVGSVIDTVSQYGGDQYTLDLIIHQVCILKCSTFFLREPTSDQLSCSKL